MFGGLLHSPSEEFADEAVEEGVQQLGKLRLVVGLGKFKSDRQV